MSGKAKFSFILVFIFVLFALLLNGCSFGGVELGPTGNGGQEEPGLFIQTEEIVIAMLLLAAVVSIVTQRLRIPYTVGLVLVGFGLAFLGQIPFLTITPEVILALLVPPLVFEAAFHINFMDLRRELRLILLLAIPGVILTTLMVGGIVSVVAGFSLPVAMVFGALIAATDPVAVVALFRSMGAPKRLQVLLEGESLLNDGTAIVVFNMMVVIALTGQFNLGTSVLQFFIVAGGGILVGVVAGILISQMIGRIDNYLIETTLTTVLAYGSYLIAEYILGVSGVLAVVAAGLAGGHIGPRGMSPTTRIVVFNFWEYAAFLANSFVFLIIGLEIDLNLLIQNAGAIGWGILAVLVARAVTVYGLASLASQVPARWKNVLFWGGMRGAISLALALSLDAAIPNRTEIQAMAFGVVLFTLVVEGLTMKTLVKRSGLVQGSAAEQAYDREHAQAVSLLASYTRLRNMNREGLVSDYTWRQVKPVLTSRIQEKTGAVQRILEEHPQLHEQELMDAWREGLRVQRVTITSMFRDNIISEDIYEELVSAVDFELIEAMPSWETGIPSSDEGVAFESED